MDGLVMTAQMILALSIIVGIHEFGHLITAKIFGMKVEKYFIGFPPKIWSINYKGTEYGLGSIPLGGFVKISGIIDESMDTEHINKPPESWEFRSKPPWQRLIVMLGGILFNVITGLIIFTIITFSRGDIYLSKDEINKNGILALELGEEVGFITGDKILKINGEDWERDTDLFNPNLFLDNNTTFSILRDNNEIDIKLPNNFINKMNSKEALSSFLKARTPFYVDSVFINENAYKAGILSGDEIIKID
ncbi:MAG: site-2 protease family protein, partial [Bacteroidota bacterium]|nr:site-2 protease family protein [Bacteroidota bacterium]